MGACSGGCCGAKSRPHEDGIIAYADMFANLPDSSGATGAPTAERKSAALNSSAEWNSAELALLRATHATASPEDPETELNAEEGGAMNTAADCGVRYSYEGQKGILDLTRDAGIQWLKGRAFGDLLRDPGHVLRQQDVARRTDLVVKDPNDLYRSGSYPLVVSHFWLTKEHPDPNGDHARKIVAWLGAWRGLTFAAVFMDYMSLPQHPRSEPETAAFYAALRHMDLLYAHDRTFVLHVDGAAPAGVTAYRLRGWCRFERLASATKGVAGRSLSLSGRDGVLCPRTPEAFDGELAGLHFAREADQAEVSRLHRQLFAGKVQQLGALLLRDVDAEEGAKVAVVLPHMSKLRMLRLKPLDGAAADALGRALCGALEAGHAPRLKQIYFGGEHKHQMEMSIRDVARRRSIKVHCR